MYEIKGTNFVAMDQDEYLEHFGIPGMKWGHRKELAASRKSMRRAEARGSGIRASDRQKRVYKKASAKFYNEKRALNGKAKVDTNTAAYRQDIKNDAVKGSKYLAESLILSKSTAVLAGIAKNAKPVSPFLANVASLGFVGLNTATKGLAIAGTYHVAKAGVKRIRGGKNGN